MKIFRKKRIIFGSAVVVLVVVALFVARRFFFDAPSTSDAAQKATEWQHNPADIICEETGTLITLEGDWHRWRGENFDGMVKDANLNLNWSTKKPPLTWLFRYAGAGYSGPAVVGTTLYMSGAAQGHDFAFALDTKTGNMKWQQVLGEHFVQSYGDGPRGTITVDDDKLYLVRGGGQIHCLAAVDGQMIWQRDFVADFGGRIMGPWGYSESPLVDGELIICTPGGSGGTMVALNKNTGATVWISKEWTDIAGYSSPIVAVVDDVRQYIQQSDNGVAGIRAEDGKLLWSVKVPGYRIAVVPTPVYYDNTVFVSTGYNAGCAGIRLTKRGETFNAEMIFNNKNMVNHHGGVVLVDGYIYGYSDAGGWVCQDFRTGETAWNTRRARR
ncbi:MAG: PQQ-like beta-propeller repeat protein, partial [Bacteroidales bacterium]|nr:PQQ-like beta-propeller repeat protein [Bacteroidales bacterium]